MNEEREIIMDVSGWSNGGSTFGIRVGAANRDMYFDRSWKRIVLVVDGVDHPISLTAGFWIKCPELRGGVIRDWLQEQGLDSWQPGKPPRFTLVPLGEARFRLDR